MMNFSSIVLGFDLDAWVERQERVPIQMSLAPADNSHILACGMSGSGKSYFANAVLAKLAKAAPDGELYLADYKQEDSFSHLRGCPRYFSYKNVQTAVELVYERLKMRLSGTDPTRHQITLVFDEYMAYVLYLMSEDKKAAAATMSKISEILLMGRSLSVRFGCVLQRPDALAFPAGSRLNYGVIVILGAAIRSIYDMLMPDHREQVEGREFGRGEGVVLFQNSALRFIKVPQMRDEQAMKQICVEALSTPLPESLGAAVPSEAKRER